MINKFISVGNTLNESDIEQYKNAYILSKQFDSFVDKYLVDLDKLEVLKSNNYI
jgi:hypothetical protein